MRHLVFTGFLLLFFSDHAAAQNVKVSHEPDGSVVVTQMKFTYSFRPPTDWHESTWENIPPAYFPRKANAVDRTIQISADSNDKSIKRVRNVPELVASEMEQSRLRDPQTRYELIGTLKIANGTAIPLYSFRWKDAQGLAAYADEKRTIINLSLCCPSDEATQANRAVFEQFVASYRFISPPAPAKRR